MISKILLIEDEKIMRITLVDYLTSLGYEVDSFEKGQDGLKAFHDKEYSLVITDVRLPDISGQEVARRIKELKKTIEVIIITAFGTIRESVEFMKLGAFDYITKPFSLDEFSEVIERALDKKGFMPGTSD